VNSQEVLAALHGNKDEWRQQHLGKAQASLSILLALGRWQETGALV
jgi:hypothetical protein